MGHPNVWVTVDGEKLNLSQAARKVGLHYSSMKRRYLKGQRVWVTQQ